MSFAKFHVNQLSMYYFDRFAPDSSLLEIDFGLAHSSNHSLYNILQHVVSLKNQWNVKVWQYGKCGGRVRILFNLILTKTLSKQ